MKLVSQTGAGRNVFFLVALRYQFLVYSALFEVCISEIHLYKWYGASGWYGEHESQACSSVKGRMSDFRRTSSFSPKPPD